MSLQTTTAISYKMGKEKEYISADEPPATVLEAEPIDVVLASPLKKKRKYNGLKAAKEEETSTVRATEFAKFKEERKEHRHATGITLCSGRRAHKIRQHTLALNDAVEVIGDLPQPDVLKYVGLGDGQSLPCSKLSTPLGAIAAARGLTPAIKAMKMNFQPGA